MKRIKRGDTVYYSSLTEDMIPHKESGGARFSRRGVARVPEFILYSLLAYPVAALYSSFILKQRIVGRELLPKEGGYILMLNHNEPCGDAFTPPLVTAPVHCHTVVHPDNVRLPVVGRFLPYLGAIPLPDSLRDTRAFCREIEERLSAGRAVAIYPEARVWPGCGFIRPFERGAFDLAVRLRVPVFTATRVYRRSRLGTRATVFVDGPFLPSDVEDGRRGAGELSLAVFSAMQTRVAAADTVSVDYRPREEI